MKKKPTNQLELAACQGKIRNNNTIILTFDGVIVTKLYNVQIELKTIMTPDITISASVLKPINRKYLSS